MAAAPTQGIQLFWSTSTVLSTASSCLVGSISDIKGPSASKKEIDVTTMDSSAMEYLLGLPDFGDVTLDMIYEGADVAQNALYADSILATSPQRRCVIKLTDSASHAIMFKGYAKPFSWSMTKEDAIKLSGSIRVTGQATLTTTIA